MKKHGSLNHIYRLVWSQVLKTWVAVAENTKGRGKAKNSRSKLVAAALAITAFGSVLPPALAGPAASGVLLPTGAQVSAGSVNVSQSGNTLTVTENTQRAAVNWQTFSISNNGTVNFVQSNSAAVILNRVVGTEASLISGALNANGQVFLLNSNGLLFAKNASVNTGGLIASTLNMSDNDFMSGKTTFTGNGSRASVINQGSLTSGNGYVALLGNQVVNQGVITARLGTAILAAGDQISLNFQGNSLVSVVINKGTLDALVSNQQAILADGGLVMLTAKGADTVLASAVNNTGEIRAQTIANKAGKIYLLGDMQNGTVNVGGAMDASAPRSGNGGYVETSAAKVIVAKNADVTTSAPTGLTGSWLIDPTDFTISAGSATQTTSGIGAATLQSDLVHTSVSIETATSGTQNGNININAPVNWSANALSLTAQGNININANLVASGTSQLVLNYGWNGLPGGSATYGNSNTNLNVGMNASGTFKGAVYFADDVSGTNARSGTGILTINGTAFTIISSVGAAADISGGSNQTLQGIARTGNETGHFALGSDINASATSSWNPCTTCNSGGAGNYGFTPIGTNTVFSGVFDGLGHVVSNLTINLPAINTVGLFSMGDISPATLIRNVGLIGASVTGNSYVGGLVGWNYGDSISNSYVKNSIISSTFRSGPLVATGGLVGYNMGSITGSNVSSGTVSGFLQVGGLVGRNLATVSNSFATASVNDVGGNNGNAGGLAGYNTGTISNSYATGNVSCAPCNSFNGSNNGGFAGYNNGTITGSFATSGAVTGGRYAGGFIGKNDTSSTISNSYSTETVHGTIWVGGFVGRNYGTIDTSYASGTASGTAPSTVGGLAGSDAGGTYHHDFYNKTVNGSMSGISAASGTPDGAATVWGMTAAAMQSQANFTSATSNNGTINPGWDFAGGTWMLYEGNTAPMLQYFMSPLTVSASATKIYNGLAFNSTDGLSYSSVPDSLHLFGVASFAGSGVNAGSYAVTTTGLWSDQLGYLITYASGTQTITPAALSITAGNATKVYGQIPALSAFTVNGLVNSETVGSVTVTSNGSVITAGVTGSPYAIIPSAATGGSFNPANYSISYVNGNLTVTPLALAISAHDGATRVYDGTANAAASLLAATNLINGDTVTLSGNGTLAGSVAGSEALTGLSGLSITNPNYTLTGAIPVGSVLITASGGESTGGNPDLTNVIADAHFSSQTINYLPAELTATVNPAGLPAVIPTTSAQLAGMFGDVPLAIVSAPNATELTQVVSMSQARALLQSGTGGGDGSGSGDGPTDVRVPVARNSLAEIVNGGVRLPTGVEQQLFVVKN